MLSKTGILYEVKKDAFENIVQKYKGEFLMIQSPVRHYIDVKSMNDHTRLILHNDTYGKWHIRISLGEVKKDRLYERSLSITKKQAELLIAELQARVATMEYHQDDLS